METVIIAINDHRKIHAIQQEFNKVLPNLKLEFFSKPNTKNGSHSDKINKEESHTLGDCRTQHHAKNITIIPSMSFSDLQQTFLDEHGLKIRVSQKNEHSWTPITEYNIPLEELNSPA